MNREDNNLNFNHIVNNNQNNNTELFNDYSNNIFKQTKPEMINTITNPNNVDNNNSINNNDVNYHNNQTNINSDVSSSINVNNQVYNQNNINSTNKLDNTKDINNNPSKENFSNNKKNLFTKLTDKKFFLILAIFTFVFTSITVGKTFYLRSVVTSYEEFFIEIEEKESEETVVYLDEEILDDSLKNVAASELISCINSSIDINNLPDNITSVIDEINDYYNQSNNYFSFKYKDIYTGFTISYNENQKIFTASTIKAPKDIYIYEMASLGKINLDEKLTYTSRYYNDGTGILKEHKFNTQYDIRTLSNYSIVYSDNAAHNMLMDKFGRNNMLEFWTKLGTTAIFTQNSNWGVINAHDASIYMEELYRFYVKNEEYGQELMNNFLNAKTKFIKGKNNYKVANKSGWSGTAIHDVSIIFADNPYIVVALSNLGKTDYYMSYFNKANDLAYKLHTEYWKYKMNTCAEIDQY